MADPKALTLVNVGASTGPYWVRIDLLHSLLATQGLALIPVAELADLKKQVADAEVLYDAAGDVPTPEEHDPNCRVCAGQQVLRDAGKAALARRAAKEQHGNEG